MVYDAYGLMCIWWYMQKHVVRNSTVAPAGAMKHDAYGLFSSWWYIKDHVIRSSTVAPAGCMTPTGS